MTVEFLLPKLKGIMTPGRKRPNQSVKISSLKAGGNVRSKRKKKNHPQKNHPQKKNHPLKGHILYKHGYAGADEELGNIAPTKWYDDQHPFEYEFVVSGVPGVQKIFNNLQIISNWAEPDSFEYEVVGEGFDWNTQKPIIFSLSAPEELGLPQVKNEMIVKYTDYLTANPSVKKIPFIWCRNSNIFNENWPDSTAGARDINIISSVRTPEKIGTMEVVNIIPGSSVFNKEKLVLIYQKAKDIESFGRLSGNMQYLEDSWDIQIQPIKFKYAYLGGGVLKYSDDIEMKVRDKYMKVRVKYTGEKYAIINAIRTLFTISYA